MKKGLLLSVVASTMIFAGGDIAPVEPAAPASADFWGQIGFYYQAEDIDGGFGKRTRRTVQGSTGLRIKIQALCATTNDPITVSLTGTPPCWTRTKSRVTRIGAGGLPRWILTID
jgi:hypothetical protein